jgi:5-methylcytosine-specific restriction endonuclease McrA
MSSALSRRSLVLNSDHRPLAVYPLSLISGQEAIGTVLRDRAYVVDEWDDVFRSPSISIRVPRVIALKQYIHIDPQPKFCRRNVLLRDKFRCQYCGGKFSAEDLTFDHVTPRSRGGKTEWSNILMACVGCNTRKQNQMPNFSGRKGADDFRPLKMPRQPTSMELLRSGMEFLDPAIRADFSSFLYWDAELKA